MDDFRDKILLLLKKSSPLQGAVIAKKLSISPQLASYHLRKLRDEGLVQKQGSTRSAEFLLSRDSEAPLGVKLNKKIPGLEEDLVFNEVDLRLRLKKQLNKNSYEIFHYAFTEMLNNAIDHSQSERVGIEVCIKERESYFEIKDNGIGLIPKIQKEFKIDSPIGALEHVLKGKQTTDKANHSGQGIFFSSRSVDQFEIQSSKFSYLVDNPLNDRFLKESRPIKGTRVRATILKNSRRKLKAVFDEYSNADFEFDRSSVVVKLSRQKGLLSRSQAKRLLVGLDKFDRIEFNFKGVKQIGQAFADEIFRIFARRHPKKLLSYTYACESVAHMVERARKAID